MLLYKAFFLACNYTLVCWVHLLRVSVLELVTLAFAPEAGCSIYSQESSQHGLHALLKTQREDCVASLVLQRIHGVFLN